MHSSSKVIANQLEEKKLSPLLAHKKITETHPLHQTNFLYTRLNHEIYARTTQRVIVLDSKSLEPTSTIEYDQQLHQAYFQFDEVISNTKMLGRFSQHAVGEKRLAIYDHEMKRVIKEFQPSSNKISSIELLPDNRVAALLNRPSRSSRISCLAIWDLQKETPLYISAPIHADRLRVLENGNIILECNWSTRRNIIVVDSTNFKSIAEFSFREFATPYSPILITSVVSLSDNLIGVALNGMVVILNNSTQQCIEQMEPTFGELVHLATTAEYLLARNNTGALHYWNKNTFEYLGVLAKEVNHIQAFPSGKLLVESNSVNGLKSISIFSLDFLKPRYSNNPLVKQSSELLINECGLPTVVNDIVMSYIKYNHPFFNVATSTVCEINAEQEKTLHVDCHHFKFGR